MLAQALGPLFGKLSLGGVPTGDAPMEGGTEASFDEILGSTVPTLAEDDKLAPDMPEAAKGEAELLEAGAAVPLGAQAKETPFATPDIEPKPPQPASALAEAPIDAGARPDKAPAPKMLWDTPQMTGYLRQPGTEPADVNVVSMGPANMANGPQLPMTTASAEPTLVALTGDPTATTVLQHVADRPGPNSTRLSTEAGAAVLTGMHTAERQSDHPIRVTDEAAQAHTFTALKANKVALQPARLALNSAPALVTPEPAAVALEKPAMDPVLPGAEFLRMDAAQGDRTSTTSGHLHPSRGPELARAATQQLVAQIRTDPAGPYEIQLDPPELGRIAVRMVAGEAGTLAQISAERAEVLDQLRRNETQIAKDFAAAGFEGMSFSFQSGREPNQDESAREVLAETASAADGPPAPPDSTSSSLRSSGRLDIRL